MAGIGWNRINYKLGDLIEYSNYNNGNTALSIAILIKAARINYDGASKLIEHFNNHKFNGESKLRSATMKLIYIHNLYDNFTNDSYHSPALDDAIWDEYEIDKDECCGYNRSDRDLVHYLVNEFDCEEVLSGKEMFIIEKIKEDFMKVINFDVYGIFELAYSTNHIRYLTRHEFGQLEKDHIVELQIINIVCHDCGYDVTRAVAFASYFNREVNIQLLDSHTNKMKGAAVKDCLTNGTPSHFVGDIKKRYLGYIRKHVVKSICDDNEDFTDVIAALDGMLKYRGVNQFGRHGLY